MSLQDALRDAIDDSRTIRQGIYRFDTMPGRPVERRKVAWSAYQYDKARQALRFLAAFATRKEARKYLETGKVPERDRYVYRKEVLEYIVRDAEGESWDVQATCAEHAEKQMQRIGAPGPYTVEESA